MKDKQIDVYLNLNLEDILVGTLFVELLRGKEIYSFAYDESFLNRSERILIDPELSFVKGRQYKIDSSTIFGFISDSIPDRWGKNLLKRNELLKAKEEKRTPEALGESDFLLGVNDYTRQGALRFKIHGKKDFLVLGDKSSVPSLLYINKLEQLAYDIDIMKDEEIRDLFSPGSSLGGARPKATVFDNEGNLYIAKFSHKHDEYDLPKMELLANKLAEKCDLNVPKCFLLQGKRSIFLCKRFDREQERRLPYLSAMTLLGAVDGENEFYSYLDFVDLIQKYSLKPKKDLLEMFKRLVFNCLIHNSDDHLRNHGFIYKDKGFQLSPLFDINPNPDSLGLTLSIDGYEHSFNLDCCKSIAKYFSLTDDNANKIIHDMAKIIKENLLKMCKEIGINNDTLKRFEFLKSIEY